MNVKKINNRIKLMTDKTDKFKTFTLSFFFHRELNRENSSLNALVPYVLKQGSKNYPDIKIISETLEELYGGEFDCSVRKKGNDQILGFHFQFVSPQYIKDSNYINEALRFPFDIIFNPIIENDGFKELYVEREKENLIDYIEGIINDKKSYAPLRCVEEMCEGKDYALSQWGEKEEIKKINPADLYRQYKDIISNSIIDIFLTGDIDSAIIEKKINELNLEDKNINYPKNSLYEGRNKIKKVEEKLNVKQGKISLGFTTKTGAASKDRFALSVFNGVFGSGANSKLFMNVREKLSLCYYAYSRVDSNLGIMTVNSGVEFENFTKAYDEILLQLEEMKKGNITKDEIVYSKRAIENSLKAMDDSPSRKEDFYLNCLKNGIKDTIEDYTKYINEVTKEDIVKIANNITLDTIYFLTCKN